MLINNRIATNKNLPYAISYIRGDDSHKKINGVIKIYNRGNGSLVRIEINGLPDKEKNNFFALHIHEIGECIDKDKFISAKGHLNLENDKHPNHVGDLPTLYSNKGYAYMEFYTERFNPKDILNTSFILHEKPDDFKTDPSGDSGERIACGKVIKFTYN